MHELMSVTDAASYLKCSDSTVKRLIRNKDITVKAKLKTLNSFNQGKAFRVIRLVDANQVRVLKKSREKGSSLEKK